MKSKKIFLTMAFVSTLILGGVAFSSDVYANTQVNQQKILSADEANKIALGQTTNGQIIKSELDTENGALIYEIEVLENSVKKEFDIDAVSGKILKIDNGYSNKNNNVINTEVKLSMEDAKKIALDNSKNGKIKSIEFKNKNGFAFYEVEVSEGFMEREFKIDATNGNILKMERDF
ncbi:PepSY domain-containing protein [Fusobacterium russii]|uniref:PepSY domain-containing protein n=1 Tax=Fusobacterium russii TaxID=854 RepID=UPI0003A51D1D|nr:PepSY domain-containing protein [Fusobacterium russii]